MAGRERGLVAGIVSSRGAAMVTTSGRRGWGQHHGDGRGGQERQTRRHPLPTAAARAQEQRGAGGDGARGASAPEADGACGWRRLPHREADNDGTATAAPQRLPVCVVRPRQRGLSLTDLAGQTMRQRGMFVPDCCSRATCDQRTRASAFLGFFKTGSSGDKLVHTAENARARWPGVPHDMVPVRSGRAAE